MAEKIRDYIIKVPVYTTKCIECTEDELFGFTYHSMVETIKDNINNCFKPIHSSSRVKAKTSVISTVQCFDKNIEDRPCLLIRIATFNTNINDGYFEDDKKYAIGKNSRLGTDNNYVLLYPVINSAEYNSKECFFLVLVYDDPYKDSGSVSKLVRSLLNRTLNLPIQNIKSELVLKELERIGNIPELQIKYSGISFDEDDLDLKFLNYLQKTRLQQSKENIFANVPFEVMEELISQKIDTTQYQKQKFSFFNGKVEYRITKEMINEAHSELNDAAEKIFNYTVSVSQEELDNKLYDLDFILEKLSGVLANYLSNGE